MAEERLGDRLRDLRIPGAAVHLRRRADGGWWTVRFDSALSRGRPWFVTDTSLRANYERFGEVAPSPQSRTGGPR